MSSAVSRISTILIFGGTSGIGEAFARQFVQLNKKVIITGRRQERLSALAKELPGLETYALDNSDLVGLSVHIKTLVSKYPDIDTVWVNSGVQYQGDFKDLASTTDAKITAEINLNVTAPIIIARHLVPHLLGLKRDTQFWITSSGLAYGPSAAFPVYCPTKAAVHSFLVALRASVAETDLSILSIVPPFVGSTELGKGEALDVTTLPGAMPLQDFTHDIFEILHQFPANKLKEVAAGTAVPRAEAWRNGLQPILDNMKSQG